MIFILKLVGPLMHHPQWYPEDKSLLLGQSKPKPPDEGRYEAAEPGVALVDQQVRDLPHVIRLASVILQEPIFT